VVVWLNVGVLALAFLVARAGNGAQPVPGGEEFEHLVPHIMAACAPVRAQPALWPIRSFPYGPLGLQVRQASAAEADEIRSFHLGVVGAACGVPEEAITGSFYCGPECPRSRRDHLVRQLDKVKALTTTVESNPRIALVSIWAPKGELRVNDVFVMDATVREAIPSAKLGLVPSGNWRKWQDLRAYLATLNVTETAVNDLVSQMLSIGLSAVVRDRMYTRAVGVGVGDNESGILFQHPGGTTPRVGEAAPDARQFRIVEQVEPGVFYYETS